MIPEEHDPTGLILLAMIIVTFLIIIPNSPENDKEDKK